MRIQGVLKKIHAKSGQGKNGPWTAYSLGIDTDGSDNIKWFRFGFKAPAVSEGSMIAFDAVEDKPGMFSVSGPLSIDKAHSTPAAVKISSGNDQKQDSIVRQSSTDKAIQVARDMVDLGIVSLPAKKQDKYDFYLALIDTLTDRYFVSNRDPKTLEDLSKDDTDESEDAFDESAPADEDDGWSPV